MNLETKWLEDFVALAATRSFSQAALRRHVTQPAFSRRIRSLEEVLGLTLVNRQRTPVELTEAGQLFLVTARNLTEQLGEVVRHHIALARPQRLLVFGRHISPLLGHDPTKTAEPLRHFNHESVTIPLLIAPGLANLAGRPRSKAGLWQAWLDWTG